MANESVYHYDIQQGSKEWFQIKLGKFSASPAAELMMKPSTAGHNNLINRIVYERITGTTPESYTNEYIARGLELESEAIRGYEVEADQIVESVGFVELNDWVGCSPDGLIGSNGLLQVKVPKYSTHIDYCLTCKIPSKYLKQMQFELYVTGREYDMFYSYCPGLKNYLLKVTRDDTVVQELEDRLEIAIKEVEKRIEILENKK